MINSKSKNKISDSGFSVVELLLIMVIIALVSWVGLFVWHTVSKKHPPIQQPVVESVEYKNAIGKINFSGISVYPVYTGIGSAFGVFGYVTNRDTITHTLNFTVNFYNRQVLTPANSIGLSLLAGQTKSFPILTRIDSLNFNSNYSNVDVSISSFDSATKISNIKLKPQPLPARPNSVNKIAVSVSSIQPLPYTQNGQLMPSYQYKITGKVTNSDSIRHSIGFIFEFDNNTNGSQQLDVTSQPIFVENIAPNSSTIYTIPIIQDYGNSSIGSDSKQIKIFQIDDVAFDIPASCTSLNPIICVYSSSNYFKGN